MTKPKENEKRGIQILAIIILLIGGLLFIKPSLVSEMTVSSSVQPQQNIEDSIDRNLKTADIRRQLQNLKVKMENERAARIREYDSQYGRLNTGNLKLEQESHGERVVKEIEEYQRQGDDRVLDPSEIVERRIARDQVMAEYDKKYRKEYIEAFLQNAREQGLDVRLNKDLEVVDILDVGQDEPMRFPNSVSGQGSAAQ